MLITYIQSIANGLWGQYPACMEVAPKPANEAERLEAVLSLKLMGTPAEERFDRYTRFARLLFNAPIAFVSIIGEDTQWSKSIQGLEIDQSPRDTSFCSYTLLEDELLVIEDTVDDERFADSPFVINPPYVRFYAGVKLNMGDGLSVGTLCVADTKPKYPTEGELQLFKNLASLLEQEFYSQATATTDELTGLSNRRGFESIASHAIAMCKRMEKPATLMLFDIENFKGVNDDFGRDEGDKVLCDIGQLLLNEFRNSDVIARTAAFEFSVLLTGTTAGDVQKPLDNLQQALHVENMNLPFDLSYRVATVTFDPDEHENIDDLLLAGEAMLAEQKESTS